MIVIKGIKNSYSFQDEKLTITTISQNLLYVYSQLIVDGLINNVEASLNVSSFGFNTTVFGEQSELAVSLYLDQVSLTVTQVYSLIVKIPKLYQVTSNGFTCSSVLSKLSCTTLAIVNSSYYFINIFMSDTSIFPLSSNFTIKNLINPQKSSSQIPAIIIASQSLTGDNMGLNTNTIIFLNNCDPSCRTC